MLLRCFLHAWLKIRDRAKNLKETFYELSRRVWKKWKTMRTGTTLQDIVAELPDTIGRLNNIDKVDAA